MRQGVRIERLIAGRVAHIEEQFVAQRVASVQNGISVARRKVCHSSSSWKTNTCDLRRYCAGVAPESSPHTKIVFDFPDDLLRLRRAPVVDDEIVGFRVFPFFRFDLERLGPVFAHLLVGRSSHFFPRAGCPWAAPRGGMRAARRKEGRPSAAAAWAAGRGCWREAAPSRGRWRQVGARRPAREL